MKRSRAWSWASSLLVLSLAGFASGGAWAHELWILTPAEVAEWAAKPDPGLFSLASGSSAGIIAGFALFTVGWVWLGFTGARELFPDLQARLGAFGDLVAPILRFCLAWVLISSALGLEPRHGVERFSSPTLFAPDLELALLGPGWAWLRGVELLLGLGFLAGIYVRVCAAVLLLLATLGLLLFNAPILAYAGALVGVGIYLLLQGPGSFYLPFPTHPLLAGWQEELAAVPRQRAQAIMRVLTGITIFYLAVRFKVMLPNLTIGIITLYDVPLMSGAPEIFTLIMTLVEVVSGLLIVAGILLRPLSLFFLFAFLFFAALLPESWMSHALFYGVMLSFLFNGSGHWRMPEAQDKPAKIVVLGGGVAAVHAAMKIEKLVGLYTRVDITLVSPQPSLTFYPLLPEVVGGTMQPGNVVNPIRRVVPQTRVRLGEPLRIDTLARTLEIRGRQERVETLAYDELILALFPVPNLTGLPGLMAHASPIDSVGDALHIRKRILDLVEQAESTVDMAERERLLSFAVIGSGQRSCATAVEIGEMLATARTSYPVLRESGWKVYLYEDTDIPFSSFEEQIQARRDRELLDAGVLLCRDRRVSALTAREVVFQDGGRQPVGFVVNASFTLPSVVIDGHTVRWPPATEADLRLADHEHIWATASAGERRFLTTADLVALGKAAGQSAWASSQGYSTQPYVAGTRWLEPYNMGRRSLCRIGGITLGGTPAWFLSRAANLVALPGLERNLRVLIDWFLDIPFRADIAVLAPEPSNRLQRVHFEEGDEVIRQGETGDTAYVVESGHLEVLHNGRKIKELRQGDCFGEIALVRDTQRTATVRCLSACELTVLTRDDFQTLTVGSGVLAQAVQKQIDQRIAEQTGGLGLFRRG